MGILSALFGGHTDPQPAQFAQLAEPVIVDGQAFDVVYDYGDGPGLGTLQPWGVASPGWAEVDGEDVPIQHAPPAGWQGNVARSWSE
jgi:hypothetical protein